MEVGFEKITWNKRFLSLSSSRRTVPPPRGTSVASGDPKIHTGGRWGWPPSSWAAHFHWRLVGVEPIIHPSSVRNQPAGPRPAAGYQPNASAQPRSWPAMNDGTHGPSAGRRKGWTEEGHVERISARLERGTISSAPGRNGGQPFRLTRGSRSRRE